MKVYIGHKEQGKREKLTDFLLGQGEKDCGAKYGLRVK